MPVNSPAPPQVPPARQPFGPYKVCLVCLGNICRSPMAEFVLRDELARAGLAAAVSVDSAGTGDWHIGERMHGPAQAEWMDLLDDEIDNVRAALRWSLDAGDPDSGLRIGGALWIWWVGRGYIAEGRRWLSALLTHPRATQPTAARAKALYTAGMLAWYQANHSGARALH